MGVSWTRYGVGWVHSMYKHTVINISHAKQFGRMEDCIDTHWRSLKIMTSYCFVTRQWPPLSKVGAVAEYSRPRRTTSLNPQSCCAVVLFIQTHTSYSILLNGPGPNRCLTCSDLAARGDIFKADYYSTVDIHRYKVMPLCPYKCTVHRTSLLYSCLFTNHELPGLTSFIPDLLHLPARCRYDLLAPRLSHMSPLDSSYAR